MNILEQRSTSNSSAKVIAYTCCTCNYAPWANTLGHSLKRTNPGIDFIIVFIDAPPGISPESLTPFTFMSLPAQNSRLFEEMTHRYSAFELSCATKFLAGQLLMNQHPSIDSFMYFDSDIFVYADLNPVLNELVIASLVLTPHALQPLPDDGHYPDNRTFLRCGLYNAGFFGFRRSSEQREIFNWLITVLYTMCRDQPISGCYVDQKWLDLLPIFFSGVSVIRHQGVNAGHWNLHRCNLNRTTEGWQVGTGIPLVFFHFSGFSPVHPDVFQPHQNRHQVPDNEALRLLCHEYAEVLVQERYSECAAIPYGYAARAKRAKRSLPFYKRIIRALIWRAIIKWKIEL